MALISFVAYPNQDLVRTVLLFPKEDRVIVIDESSEGLVKAGGMTAPRQEVYRAFAGNEPKRWRHAEGFEVVEAYSKTSFMYSYMNEPDLLEQFKKDFGPLVQACFMKSK